MKIALCTCDFYAPVHQAIRDTGHEVPHIVTTSELDSGWNFQTAEFAKEMRSKVSVGPLTEAQIDEMKRDGVDLLISAAYDYKVPVPKDGSLKSINVHGTLLPEGRGPWPSPHILLRHPEAAGMTLHTMTDKWDHGDIVLQEKIEITDADDSDSLISKMVYLSGKLTRQLLSNFEPIWTARKPMEGKGSYWNKPTEADRTVTPLDEPERIAAIYRAFGAMTIFSDGTSPASTISKIVMWKQNTDNLPGTLVSSNNNQRIYATRNGLMSVYR